MSGTGQQYCTFDTARGVCGIAWNAAGIINFRLPEKTAAAAERTLLRRLPGAAPGEPGPEVAAAIAAAQAYFAGEQVDFTRFTLDLHAQTAFFQRVYGALREVGWGRTTTYGALAKALGEGPEAARDVGQAMAQNPVPLIIPCHRVLAAGGRLGGFSAPGGTETKTHMLELEGVGTAPPPPAQQGFSF
ncbi:MAG TPA: methylated-DNA--[protein]-cysteine S-methyltransferase [Roseomonas sp.]|jgi:methylated-DNA-[protein]-cysteine S-methyltransferase